MIPTAINARITTAEIATMITINVLDVPLLSDAPLSSFVGLGEEVVEVVAVLLGPGLVPVLVGGAIELEMELDVVVLVGGTVGGT